MVVCLGAKDASYGLRNLRSWALKALSVIVSGHSDFAAESSVHVCVWPQGEAAESIVRLGGGGKCTAIIKYSGHRHILQRALSVFVSGHREILQKAVSMFVSGHMEKLQRAVSMLSICLGEIVKPLSNILATGTCCRKHCLCLATKRCGRKQCLCMSCLRAVSYTHLTLPTRRTV